MQRIYEKEIGKKIKIKANSKYLSKAQIIEAVASIQAAQLSDLMAVEQNGNNTHTLEVILENFIKLSQSEYGFIREMYRDDQNKREFPVRMCAFIIFLE